MVIVAGEALMRLLGCWYSTNQIHPKIMEASLASIVRAREATANAQVDVRTCTWEEMPDSPFPGYVTHFKLGIHFGIVIQILRTIYEQDRDERPYDAMVFLEHDVLYAHDYFDRVAAAFEADATIYGASNLDYIGVNHTGWVQVHTRHEPMHELSLRYDFARFHFVGAGRKVQSFRHSRRLKSAERDYGRAVWFVPSRCTECRYMNWLAALFLPKGRASAKLVVNLG